MTGKERMAAAMSAHRSGVKPDRTPVMCQFSAGYMYKNAGIPPTEFWLSTGGFVSALVKLCDEYEFDGILISTAGRSEPPLETNKAEYDGGVEITYNDGRKYFYPPDEYPRPLHYDYTQKGVSRTVDEISADDIRNITNITIPKYYPDMLRMVIDERGDTHSIHGEVGTAFEQLLRFFGTFEDGFTAIMDDEPKCHKILERLNQNVIMQAEWQCEFPIDAMKLSSPFAGSGFISRSMYERLVLPYERAVVNFVHKKAGVPCYIHTCGSIGDRIDLILETGVDGIECLDPPPLGDVKFEEAVELLKNRAFIKGNLDSVNELTLPANEIIAIAKRRIEMAQPLNGAYILSSACSVSPVTPPASLYALKQASIEAKTELR
ncbi:MAG: hypothetical protein FWF92_01780 [Oscillospiraceae bacterium]|nr:hypothetical protein [Oscillospiraceae bacterium]